jgi:DNA-binding XRE family transcriptional regulator
MVNTILTPNEAKQARAALGLSQNKAAQGAGISRTKLALFEVKKYLLDDGTLLSLKQFYENLGHLFDEQASDVQQATVKPVQSAKPMYSTGVRLVDGFAVPAGLDINDTETILAELAENDNQIALLSSKKAGVSWWSEELKTEGLNELLRLHARNYLLTRLLQGHEHLAEGNYADDVEPEAVTNGQLLHNLISS